MLTALMIASLVAAEDPTARMVEQNRERREVAYEELMEGDAATALVELEHQLERNPGDPAILINLGATHTMLANYVEAEAYYRAAQQAEESYELELADGRWIDSRRAATMALGSVEVLALAD
ncbi:MAG: tetratricopeptide repeat protein [Alteraurantiacibacter sp.]